MHINNIVFLSFFFPSSTLILCNEDIETKLLNRNEVNFTDRLVTRTRKRDHVTPVLNSLHSLRRKKQRPQYNMVVCTYKALRAVDPRYVDELAVANHSRRFLRSEP